MSLVKRRVKFLKDFWFKPTKRTAQLYKSGEIHLPTSVCAEKAVNEGAAEYLDTDFPAPRQGISKTIANKRKRNIKSEIKNDDGNGEQKIDSIFDGII